MAARFTWTTAGRRPGDIAKTIANLREVRPTSMLSVPSALQMLARRYGGR